MIEEKVLVERLEEEINDAKNLWDDDEYYIGQANAYEHTIEIVNQLAEESKGKDTNVHSNNGWIPCSERLPEEDKYVLCQGNISIFIAFIDSFDGEWRDDGHYRRTAIKAWQPLPQPFKPKE